MNDEFKALIAEQRKRIRPYVLAFTPPWPTEDDVIADHLPGYKKGEQLLWRMITLATAVFGHNGVERVVCGIDKKYEETASAIAQQFYEIDEHPVEVIVRQEVSHTILGPSPPHMRWPRKERMKMLRQHRQTFTGLIQEYGTDTIFIAASPIIESCLYDKITVRTLTTKDKLLHTAPGDAVLFIADGRPLARISLSW